MKIGELCPDLKRLDIGWMWEMEVTDEVMEKVTTNCKQLEILVLSEVGITDKTLDLLGRNCPEIKNLELYACINVTEAGVRSFVSQGTKPLKLEVDIDCGPTVPEYMKALAVEYPRLKIK